MMDPRACYLAMKEAMHNSDYAAADEHAEALLGWLKGGGFLPAGMDRKAVWEECLNVLVPF
jgi:hypothetical protein